MLAQSVVCQSTMKAVVLCVRTVVTLNVVKTSVSGLKKVSVRSHPDDISCAEPDFVKKFQKGRAGTTPSELYCVLMKIINVEFENIILYVKMICYY